MKPILQIFCYIFFVIVALSLNSLIRVTGYASNIDIIRQNNTRKFSYSSVFFLSVLFFLYSIFATQLPIWGSDRYNYHYYFTNEINDNMTLGLRLIYDIVRIFSRNSLILFGFVSFFVAIIFFCSYKSNKLAGKYTLTLILFSQLLISSFHLLKQAPAIAISSIAISLILQKQKFLKSALFLTIAILFHESALVVLFLCVLIYFSKKRFFRNAIYMAMLGMIVLFPYITSFAINTICNIIPSLYDELSGFLSSDGAIAINFSFITIMKGLPFYVVTAYGFLCRNRLKDVVENYDAYLMISMFTSVMTILSCYMYWMYRFAMYGYFHTFIFCEQIVCKNSNKKEAQIFFWVVSGSLLFFTLYYLYQMFFIWGGF